MFRARWERDQQYERGQFESIKSQLATSHHLAEQVIVSVASGFTRDRHELNHLMASTLAANQTLLGNVEKQIDIMCKAGFLREETVEKCAGLRLRATSLGRLCTRLMIGPETVLRIKRQLQRYGDWTFFDVLLLCCSLPDCDPVVTVDFEELTALGEKLTLCRSHLLGNEAQDAAEGLEISPKRLLSAVKGALILLAWTESDDAERVADEMTCYENEVTRLRDSTLRLLSAMRVVLKEPLDDDSTIGPDRAYLDKKISRLELMVSAGLNEDAATLTLVPGIGKTWARRLVDNGIHDIEMLAQSSEDQLTDIGQLSENRASEWISKASQILSTDDMWLTTDVGANVRVGSSIVDLPVDVYRLKRSWQLRVEPSRDPEVFRVTGGSDPHLVKGLVGSWSCDCADRAKGHECKHLIAVRRWNGDPVIQDVDKVLLQNSNGSEINLHSWWAL